MRVGDPAKNRPFPRRRGKFGRHAPLKGLLSRPVMAHAKILSGGRVRSISRWENDHKKHLEILDRVDRMRVSCRHDDALAFFEFMEFVVNAYPASALQNGDKRIPGGLVGAYAFAGGHRKNGYPHMGILHERLAGDLPGRIVDQPGKRQRFFICYVFEIFRLGSVHIKILHDSMSSQTVARIHEYIVSDQDSTMPGPIA